MKKGIHPENYRLVAFKDMSNNDVFITKSAVETKDSIKVDGVDYHFVTQQKFKELIESNQFYEYAKIFDNYYGTLKKNVDNTLINNDIIFDIVIHNSIHYYSLYILDFQLYPGFIFKYKETLDSKVIY